MDGQVTWLDLGISCGKTWSEPLAATKEKTSQPCWKKLRVSQNQDFLYLDCRKSGNGQKQEPSTVMGGLSLGELTTLRTGEKPSETAVQEMLSVWGPHSVAEESRLSQILEVNPLPKYNLTAKACLGILRRAEQRGKDLPERLKAVLIRQSQGDSPQERTEAPAPTEAPTSYAVRIRGGCDGGGKGALVQTEKSGTLGTGNDQTIFQSCITPWDCQSKRIFGTSGEAPTLQGGIGGGVNNPAIFCLATQQGGAELRTDDRSPTLTAGDRHGVTYISGVDGYNGDLTGDVASTIGINCGMSTGRSGVMEPSANENGGMARDSVLCAGFKAGQGAQAGGIGYSEEVSPTLAAAPSGTNQTPAVVALDMTHACDVIRECGEQVPALQARMGTGGNQVPLTYGIGNGQVNEAGIMAEEVSQTLNTMHDAQAVMCEDVSHALRAKANCAYREDAETYICSAVDCRNGQESDVGGALQARTGHTLNANGVVRSNMLVRRLTPLECTRLQGYPDGWVDIGDWTDEKGKKHKDADSPKYKALGNSIALPFWDWMLRRMARYLPEGATLGSLFDGIGGFPLCFERIHGKGTARWASEIEPFPIAVTKRWFGEE